MPPAVRATRRRIAFVFVGADLPSAEPQPQREPRLLQVALRLGAPAPRRIVQSDPSKRRRRPSLPAEAVVLPNQ